MMLCVYLYLILTPWDCSSGEIKFEDMPISKRTMGGLVASNLTVATEIQAAAIPHALAGRDILGAAKTGSGLRILFRSPCFV